MKKAQIIIPTGGGKTLLEHIAVNKTIQNDGLVHIVLAPRIALVHQLINEFWNYKSENWKPLCVCSSQAELSEYYEGESANGKIETSTKSQTISGKIKHAIESLEPLVIFGTLHSAEKIAIALRQNDYEADIVIMDEAHNLTQETWGKWLTDLPSKRQLYFTATRRVSRNINGEGRGMDNRALFGEVIHQVSPAQVIEDGSIVPPRLHFMYPTQSLDVSNEKEYLRGQIMMVVGGTKKHHEVMNGAPTRIIVFCEGAEDAHDMAECKAIQDTFPDWYIAAVTSKTTRMKDKRSNIFNKFSDSENSIMFHYDVISEGIDLPGITAILPLRELGEIKIVQAIGRALRVTVDDRRALAEGRIKVGDDTGWQKPYGWVILPFMGGDLNYASGRITEVAFALREAGFDADVETISVVEKSKLRKPEPEGDFDYVKPEVVGDLFEGLEETFRDIDRKVTHDLESEDNVTERSSPIMVDKIEGLFRF